MGFMEAQAVHMSAWHVETTIGGEIVPADLVSSTPSVSEIQPYLEGEPYADDKTGKIDPDTIELETGWYSRFSAPGYMDRTDWMGPETSEDAALDALAEAHDCCRECWEQCWDSDEPCEQEPHPLEQLAEQAEGA